MSLLETIDDLATHLGVTVQRRLKGTMTNGKYVQNAPTTFTADIVLQPAFNLNRVVGGANLDAKVDLQHATDIRVFYTRTQFFTRSATTDPDVIIDLDGADWTVARVETWTLGDDTHYRVICTRVTMGAA